jgi:hypothetical protein
VDVDELWKSGGRAEALGASLARGDDFGCAIILVLSDGLDDRFERRCWENFGLR